MPVLNIQKIKGSLSTITALSAPSSKTPLPAYQSISVSLGDKKLRLRCDGPAGSGELKIDVDSEESFGEVFVDTQKFNAAITALGTEVSVSSKEGGIELSNSKTSIQLRPCACIPGTEIGSDVSEWFKIDGKSIANAISRTYGVFESSMAITLSDKGIVWCSTSGNTMVIWTEGLSIPVGAKIPKESCRVLVSALNSGECEVGKQDNLYVLRFTEDGLQGTLALRVFDDFSKSAVFSYSFTQKPKRLISQVLKSDIVSALNACAVVQTAENTRVLLRSNGSQLMIDKAATDYGCGKSVVNLQNMKDGAKINEQHCAQRLAKAIASASLDEPSVDIYEFVLNADEGEEFTNLAFVAGNTIALCLQIQT